MHSLIILAAGGSERFGRNKLLEPTDGVTLIERVVRAGLESKADEVVVVLGHDADRMRNVLQGCGCKMILNEQFHEGQSSSVKCGVRAVVDHAEAALILPGDCALVSADAIGKVIDAFTTSNAPIVVASHEGRRGHPILIARRLFDEVLQIGEATRGLKGLLGKHRPDVLEVNTGSDDVLIDLDTREEFEKYFPRRTS